jgi:hypothetical protein
MRDLYGKKGLTNSDIKRCGSHKYRGNYYTDHIASKKKKGPTMESVV